MSVAYVAAVRNALSYKSERGASFGTYIAMVVKLHLRSATGHGWDGRKPLRTCNLLGNDMYDVADPQDFSRVDGAGVSTSIIDEALGELDCRRRVILTSLLGYKIEYKPQRALAEQFGISAARVGQLSLDAARRAKEHIIAKCGNDIVELI